MNEQDALTRLRKESTKGGRVTVDAADLAIALELASTGSALKQCLSIAAQRDLTLGFANAVMGDPKYPQIAFRKKFYDDPLASPVHIVLCGSSLTVAERLESLALTALEAKAYD